MNPYGQRLYEHFLRHDPDGVAALHDPIAFFADAGDALEREIEESVAAAVGDREVNEAEADSFDRRSRVAREVEADMLALAIATVVQELASLVAGGDRSVQHDRDHVGRLATFYSESGLGL